MNKNTINLLLAILCLILGLLVASCNKQVDTPTNKVQPKITPYRPLIDTFVVRKVDKFH